ncbi:hypothetical protein CATMQ487_30250 [Sphaerotilus microaerophilus]|uniref:Uncharacterized domain-containing protein n=1 Tax=Sphaerotilus microaerophilus TaxID=2914710 RepID=A0ABN6PQA2_9BURK|nr:hypothetical protein CATMQ487_30250 [Sphaerotilus sp. FB-5]
MPSIDCSAVAADPWPGSDAGLRRLPVVAIDSLLAAQAGWLTRIRLAHGGGIAGFEAELLPLIQRYASCVHLLPAASEGPFSEAGGLFQLGLQTAFFALQGTDARIFAGPSSLTTRQQLEPRWRLATFAAGLCGELHRVADRLEVSDEAGQQRWHPLLEPLVDWLQRQQMRHYQFRWLSRRPSARSLGLFLLPQVLPQALLRQLAEGHDLVLPHLMASVSGVPVYPEPNVLDALVRRALWLCLQQGRSPSNTGEDPAWADEVLQRELIDGMRQLAASDPGWVVNREKSRLWWAADGAYVVWPGGGEDVLRLLTASGLIDLPRGAKEAAEVLLRSGAVEPRPDGSELWSIRPPGGRGALDALKLRHPGQVGLGTDSAPAMPLADELCTRSAPAAAIAVPRRPMEAFAPAPAATPPDSSAEELFAQATASAMPTSPTEQLTLLEDSAAPTSEGVPSPPEPTWVLDAPLRLSPAIRSALAVALASPALQPQWGARASEPQTPSPLFVPLSALSGTGPQPAAILRALREAGMLEVAAGEAPTVQRMLDGVSVPGLLLSARYLRQRIDAC